MSYHRLVSRLVLAAAAIFTAAPVLGQAPGHPAAVPVAPAFPYGKFVMQPAPGTQADPQALTVVFTDGFMQVYKRGALTHTDGMLVAGDRWQVWQDSGPCGTPTSVVGTYRWSFVGGVLSFALIEDACPDRSAKVLATRLVQLP